MELARRLARWLPPVGLVAFLVLSMWHLDTVAAWLQWMDEQGPVGDAVFVAFYLLATVATLASWILEGGAGFLYGPLLGVPIAVGLGTIGATCGFGLGRTLLRGWVERRMAADPRLAAMDRAIRDDGLRLVFLLRLSPLAPFNLMSVALGATPVPLRSFLVGTVLGHLFPVLVFVYSGSAVASALELVARPPLPAWATAGGLALTVVATIGVTRFVRRALARP